MSTFTLTGPQGRTYETDGSEGSPPEPVISFVAATSAPGPFGVYFDFWTPKPVGHEPTDHARGAEFAREAMAWANIYGNPTAIQFPLMEIVARGSLTPLERGFIERIAEAARCGIQN